MNNLAGRLGMSDSELNAARASIKGDFVVLSGKMASGKDAVAEGLNNAQYGGRAALLRYGDAMRRELEPVLQAWRSAPEVTEEAVATLFRDMLGISSDEAAWAADQLGTEMEDARWTLSAWDRTPGLRRILQALGGPWRLDADEDYWARQTTRTALELLAEQPVILTGGRFLPDVELPRALGAIVLRIEIDADTQRARLGARDGLTVDPEAVAHPGETLLDDWPHFDARIDNSGTLEEAVTAARHHLEKRRRVHRPTAAHPANTIGH